jgi:4'-phosphopantetheinyl transferase superfamily
VNVPSGAVVFYATATDVDYTRLDAAWQDQLGDEELERLASLRFEHDRRDYLAAHVLRRLATRSAVGRSSLTHCDGFVAVAFSGDPARRVGVDAEPVTAEARLMTMADEFSSPAERASLTLVQLWTAKEAALKARGVGLAEAGGLPALRGLECRADTGLDGWATIAIRHVGTGERHEGWTRVVGGHVLTVVMGDRMGESGPPRLTQVAIQ